MTRSATSCALALLLAIGTDYWEGTYFVFVEVHGAVAAEGEVAALPAAPVAESDE